MPKKSAQRKLTSADEPRVEYLVEFFAVFDNGERLTLKHRFYVPAGETRKSGNEAADTVARRAYERFLGLEAICLNPPGKCLHTSMSLLRSLTL